MGRPLWLQAPPSAPASAFLEAALHLSRVEPLRLTKCPHAGSELSAGSTVQQHLGLSEPSQPELARAQEGGSVLPPLPHFSILTASMFSPSLPTHGPASTSPLTVTALVTLGVSLWPTLYSSLLWSPFNPALPSPPASAHISCTDLHSDVFHGIPLGFSPQPWLLLSHVQQVPICTSSSSPRAGPHTLCSLGT